MSPPECDEYGVGGHDIFMFVPEEEKESEQVSLYFKFVP